MSFRVCKTERAARICYAGLFGLSAAAALAKTLVYAKVVDPAGFGAVNLAILIATLGSYFATLGITEGLSREVPILAGQERDSIELRSSALTAVLVLASLVGLVIAIACFSIALMYPEFIALPWSAALLFGNVLVNSVLCDLQIRERSIEYAAVLVMKNLLPLACASSFADLLGVHGVLLAEFLSLIVCSALCVAFWSRDLRILSPFTHAVARLIKIGSPFTVSSLVQNLSMNLDRWAVHIYLGAAALGAYVFAMQFASIGLVFLNMVSLYAAPRLLRTYGATNDVTQVLRRTSVVGIIATLLFAIGALPFLLLFPDFVFNWFPEYQGAVTLTAWVYIGTIAMSGALFDILFRAVGNGKPLIFIQAGVALFATLGCVLVGDAHASLAGFAIIFAIARIATAVAGWYWGVVGLSAHRIPSQP